MNSPTFSTDNQYIKYRIEVTQNSQSQFGNSSNVTVKVWFWRTNTGYETYGSGTVYCIIDGWQYTASVRSSQKITHSGIYLFSTTVSVPHNNDGTKTLEVSCRIDHSRVESNWNTASFVLTTIPRASRLSAPPTDLGTSMTITITRDIEDAVDNLRWQCGSEAGNIASDVTTNTVIWQPPLSLASLNTQGEYVTIVLYCDTETSAGVVMGTTVTSVQCKIPDSVKPSVDVDITDNSGNFPTYQCFLQGHSTMLVAITATGQYGASIVSYTSVVEGKTYTGASFTTDVIASHGSVSVEVTVRDSRGRTTTYTGTFTVVEYNEPQITSLVAYRCNEDGQEYYQGQYCKVVFSASITSIDGKNSAGYRVEYKKQEASAYTSQVISGYNGQYSVVDGSAMFAADNSSGYNIYLCAVDDFGESKQYIFSPSMFRLMHFGADGQSMAFFKRCPGDVPGDFGEQIRLSKGYKATPINSVDDLDDLINPGFYVSDGYSGVSNEPFSYGEYSLEVRALSDSGDMMQIADRHSSDGHEQLVRYRGLSGETYVWSDWAAVFAMHKHTHALDGDDLTGSLPLSKLLADDTDVDELVDAIKGAILDVCHPVGSIYISVNPTSPTTLFGGTWTQIQDRFLLAAGPDFPAGTEGGSRTHSHLSPVGISGSNNLFGISYSVGATNRTLSGNVAGSNTQMALTSGTYTFRLPTTSTADVVPPYIAVYVWQRIA